jgi:hypothetical protein
MMSALDWVAFAAWMLCVLACAIGFKAVTIAFNRFLLWLEKVSTDDRNS